MPVYKSIVGLVLTAILVAVAFAADPPAVPDDFKLMARFAPGYSNWLSWRYTITADGKVAQVIGPGGRGGGERTEKEDKITKEDVVAIVAKVKDADFFKLKEQYKGKATDQATLVLEVTQDKKTHQVLLYGPRFLREKEDQDAADRFLAVWAEVLRKVPAPNPDQKPEMYKPGNYAGKKM
jgi:hypothetical protein